MIFDWLLCCYLWCIIKLCCFLYKQSQKCEADHDGPCLIERKATRPGYDSEDEAKANQREDRKKGLIGSKKNGGASKAAAAPKRTNNVRLGNTKSKSKNKNKNKNKDKDNKDESGSDSDNYQSGFLLANEKQFERYLYKKNKNKKRYQTQRGLLYFVCFLFLFFSHWAKQNFS